VGRSVGWDWGARAPGKGRTLGPFAYADRVLAGGPGAFSQLSWRESL
jgi:hypothetical protein